MNKLIMIVAIFLASSAMALEEVDSRDYTCNELKTVLATNGGLIINSRYYAADSDDCRVLLKPRAGYTADFIAGYERTQTGTCHVGWACRYVRSGRD